MGPSRQKQGRGKGNSSQGCLLTASGDQWLRKSLNFGIPASKPTHHNPVGPAHHTSLFSHLNFWPLQHHVGALEVSCFKGFSIWGVFVLLLYFR